MSPQDLRSLPPESAAHLPPVLRALWEAAHGRWDDAHEIAQAIDTREGSWIHAFLHRQEGDAANAGYWYRRAGRPVCAASLDQEWTELATALLHSQTRP